MIQIKEIPSKETYIVRQPVLRKGQPIESCIFEGDDLETTYHFGLFDNKILTGIVSLFEKINPIFAGQNQAQIRGDGSFRNTSEKRIWRGFSQTL
jgi:hypothetical protein